ncbi:hypothetical protein [Spirosoma fluminis]
MMDLLFSGGNNVGGNYLIRFTPVVGIQAMPTPATNGPTTPATFYSGYRWFDCYGTEGTKAFSEDEQTTDNGPIWNVTVNAFLPGDSAERRQQLAELVRHRFVVEIIDNNGQRRRVGSKLENLELSYEFKTGAAAGDRQGATLSFKGQLTQPAPILTY